jgi:hypothetical protein
VAQAAWEKGDLVKKQFIVPFAFGRRPLLLLQVIQTIPHRLIIFIDYGSPFTKPLRVV